MHVVTSAHHITPSVQDSGGTRRSTRFQDNANDPDARLAAKLQAELDEVMIFPSASPGSRASESNQSARFLAIMRHIADAMARQCSLCLAQSHVMRALMSKWPRHVVHYRRRTRKIRSMQCSGDLAGDAARPLFGAPAKPLLVFR